VAAPGRLIRAPRPGGAHGSAPQAAPAQPRPRTPKGPNPLGLGGVYVVLAIAVGVAAMWPIYDSWRLLLMAAVAVGVSAGLVVLARNQRWKWWQLFGAGLGLFLLLGVPLAVPAGIESLDRLLPAVQELLRSLVLGWKQLVTIVIPVGVYQGLLVPAYVILIVSTCASLWLLGRRDRWWVLSVPVAIAPFGFAIAFGPSAPGQAGGLLGLRLPAAREVALGALLLVIVILLLRWHQARERTERLRTAERESGVRSSMRVRAQSRLRAVVVGGVMVAIAGLIAVWLVPPMVGAERGVLRAAILPELDRNALNSPLVEYRRAFADGLIDQPALRYDGDWQQAGRLRMAVLRYYDGELFQTVNPALGPESHETVFRRLPFRLSGPSQDEAYSLEVGVENYQGLWLPTAGALAGISFSGQRAEQLQEGFFFAQPIQAGVNVIGFQAGDGYTIDFLPLATEDVASFTRPVETDRVIATDAVPESVTAWVRRQQVSADGAGLVEAVQRLRSRGYLSHALQAGAAAPAGTGEPSQASARWIEQLGPDYDFRPSLPGHTMARIDALFNDLLVREDQAGPEATEAQLVAAVGDDEQFAVAAALVARELGFDARIVVGYRLQAEDASLPVCADGICRFGDLAVWIEVQDTAGRWGVLDVTPQHTLPLSQDQQQLGLPRLPTEVRPEAAQEQRPEGVAPGQGGGDEPVIEDEFDFTPIVRVSRDVALGVLLALLPLSPLLVLLIAKRIRRKRRQRHPDPALRIVGAWDELVDNGIDWGRPAPGRRTRAEQARQLGTPHAARLAARVDRAVFSARQPDHAEADAIWQLTIEERRALGADHPWWRRVQARLSARSFLRYLQPAPSKQEPAQQQGSL